MKILLINPSAYADTGKCKTTSPPLSLLYLAGYLEKNGYPDTKVVDADKEKLTWQDVGNLFLKEKPDIVGIGGASIYLPAIIKTAKIAKDVLPNCLVAVGGFGPSNEPEKVLRTQAVDAVVVGEGEETLLELVKTWENNQRKSFDSVNGIAFINQKGEFVLTKKRDYIKDLDSLPLPAFHLLTTGFSKYPGTPLDPKKFYEIKKPIITILASRGCPHRCVFCSLGSKMYRQRSPKKVVDEIELYKNKFGVKSVALYDDEFVGMSRQQNKWVEEICDEIIKRNLGLKFIIQGRCSQFIDLQTLKKMKKAGFAWIWFGVESGSQRLLDEVIHKDITIENVQRTFALTKEAGIKSLMFLMVGFPKETLSDVKSTMDLIRKVRPDAVSIKIVTPYPGTELRRYLETHNLLDNKLEKLSDYYKLTTDRYVNHHTEEMTAEDIRKYHRLLMFKFGHERWYFIKFGLKSLSTLDGWVKIFKRIKIIFENLSGYLKISSSK